MRLRLHRRSGRGPLPVLAMRQDERRDSVLRRRGAQPGVGTQLQFGQVPAIDAYDGRTGQPVRLNHPERPPLDWGPEQTIVVHVSDYMPEIEALLANFLPGSAATKVNVYLSAFYFADGMEWGLGRYSVPDPDHPGKFKPLPANYFPGKRGRNWPPGYNQ